MSRGAFDVEAALEKCHKGTAWQRDLIREQLIAARAAALEEAAGVCERIGPVMAERYSPVAECITTADECADAIRALKETE